jgi:hypothetical protein
MSPPRTSQTAATASGARRRTPARRYGLVACVALATGGPAFGHGLELDVRVDGTTLRGTARYTDLSPIAREQVQVHTPAEAVEPSQTLTTAGDGRFSLDGVAGRSYRFVLDAGEGHRIERTASIPAQSAQDGGSARPLTGADLDAALLPLREDLAALARQWRMTDLFAAIGYVFGIFGLVAWLRGGRS